jgi:prepilin-type N-terminal cleavage/methylation domain-containing protein
MKIGRIFNRARGQRGMSLIEVLTSVSIFGIVASGATVGTIASVKGNTSSRMQSAASALIQAKVEQLRSYDPAVNQLDFLSGTHTDLGNPLTGSGATGGKFNRYWTVTRNVPATGMAEVVVMVTYDDGRPRTLQSSTYICITKKCA